MPSVDPGAPVPNGNSAEPEEVHRAHPQRVLLFAALVAAGAAFGHVMETWIGRTFDPISEAAEADPEAAMRKVGALLERIAIFMALCSVAAGVAIERYARRVSAESRFPTRATITLTDMPVVTGAAAERRARALSGIAAIVVVSGLALAWFVSRLVAEFV